MPVLFLGATTAALLPEPVAAKPEQAGFLCKLALREFRTWPLGELRPIGILRIPRASRGVRPRLIRSTGPFSVFSKNASTTPRLAKPLKTRESGRRSWFSPSSPRTFFAIVRDSGERRRRPLYPRLVCASEPELPPVALGDELDVLVAVAADELVDEGAERQYLEPALAGVLERGAYEPRA